MRIPVAVVLIAFVFVVCYSCSYSCVVMNCIDFAEMYGIRVVYERRIINKMNELMN